jgi:hypothetical protein
MLHPIQLPVCCRIKKLVRQYSCSINNSDISVYHRDYSSVFITEFAFGLPDGPPVRNVLATLAVIKPQTWLTLMNLEACQIFGWTALGEVEGRSYSFINKLFLGLGLYDAAYSVICANIAG